MMHISGQEQHIFLKITLYSMVLTHFFYENFYWNISVLGFPFIWEK